MKLNKFISLFVLLISFSIVLSHKAIIEDDDLPEDTIKKQVPEEEEAEI